MKRLYDARPSNIRPFMDRDEASCFLNSTYLTKSTVAPVVFQRVFAYHRSQYSHYSAIYTDGSETRADYVGCGVVIEDIMHDYRLDTCSFSAEAVAIYRALQLIDSTMPRKYCIYTDSMSTRKRLKTTTIAAIQWNHRQRASGQRGKVGDDPSAARSSLSDMKRVILHHIFKIWQESWSPQLDNKLHSVKPVIEHGL
ncbi:pggt1b [Trichonephila clavipes]|nr:pggt1b [Trichonephila clavipes]